MDAVDWIGDEPDHAGQVRDEGQKGDRQVLEFFGARALVDDECVEFGVEFGVLDREVGQEAGLF